MATIQAHSLVPEDRLTDGSIILGVTPQQCWIYVVALRDGRLVRRRYRRGNQLDVERAV